VSEICKLTHIYPGELLRQEAEKDSPFALRIKEYLGAGLLVPSDIVLCLVERELARSFGRFVLDGFPRTIIQALELEFLLEQRKEKLDAVIILEVSLDEILRRLLARGRSDDVPELIEQRVRVFHEETDPVIEFYRQKEVLLPVNGIGPPEVVTQRIFDALQVEPASCSLDA
jgi:adenylate kinase